MIRPRRPKCRLPQALERVAALHNWCPLITLSRVSPTPEFFMGPDTVPAGSAGAAFPNRFCSPSIAGSHGSGSHFWNPSPPKGASLLGKRQCVPVAPGLRKKNASKNQSVRFACAGGRALPARAGIDLHGHRHPGRLRRLCAPAAGAPCRGCFGKAGNIYDPGAKLVSAISSTFDSEDPKELAAIVKDMVDLTGTFYRYTAPSQCILVPKVASLEEEIPEKEVQTAKVESAA